MQCWCICNLDLNNDGLVNVMDVLILIAEWGECNQCSADINEDGYVQIQDILILIGAWGPCPDSPEVTKVEVTWPTGTIQTVEEGLTIDSRLLITESSGLRSSNPGR